MMMAQQQQQLQYQAQSQSNIYVRNLPASLEDDAVKSIFSAFGVIEAFRLIKNPNALHKPRAALIKFSTPEQAAAAITGLHGAYLAENQIEVKFADTEPKERAATKSLPPSDNLYIKNIPEHYTEEHVKALFAPYGTVVSCRVLCGKSELVAGIPAMGGLGSAMVRLSSVEEATSAIQGLSDRCLAAGPGGAVSGPGLSLKYADPPQLKAAKAASRQQRYAPYPVLPQPGVQPAGGAAAYGLQAAGYGSVGSYLDMMAAAVGGGGPPPPPSTVYLPLHSLAAIAPVPAASPPPGAVAPTSAIMAAPSPMAPSTSGVPAAAAAAAAAVAAAAVAAAGPSSAAAIPPPSTSAPLPSSAAAPSSSSQPPSSSSATLYVRSFPTDWSELAAKVFLYEKFAPFGAISSLRVLFDDAGGSRGVAFVNYSDPSSAGRALLALQSMPVGDRLLHVSFKHSKTDGGQPGGGGQQQPQVVQSSSGSGGTTNPAIAAAVAAAAAAAAAAAGGSISRPGSQPGSGPPPAYRQAPSAQSLPPALQPSAGPSPPPMYSAPGPSPPPTLPASMPQPPQHGGAAGGSAQQQQIAAATGASGGHASAGNHRQQQQQQQQQQAATT